MTIGLHNLKAPKGANKKRKIVGRGPSSGHGNTSTRGMKGQGSRAGRDFYPGFEGGQVPLMRKIPKRGFTSRNLIRYQIINLKDLSRISDNAITPETLQKYRIIKHKDKPVKILGTGFINRPVNIKASAFSKSAKTKIEQAGGTCSLL
ncbi:MAG: 50S ribosomal protein L15 [Candidatus Omnitrophota bacterium]